MAQGYGRSDFLKYELNHFQQRSNWDCGISCILMVLPASKRKYLLDNFDAVCREEGFGKSTWTIDLCYLLRRLEMRHLYMTTVLGVNQRHENDRYYKNILPKDTERVNARFQEAEQKGVIVDEGALTTNDLIEHLANYGPVILLTNSELLSCDVCKKQKLSNELRGIFPVYTDFSGHYIVLCGYNLRFGKVLYRNPAMSDQICTMTLKQLDAARGAFGTDNDVILMFNQKKKAVETDI